MRYTVFLFITAVCLGACSKEALNEKRLAGIWEGKKVKYIFYHDNQEVRDSTAGNSGALYLYDDDELDNQFRYSLAVVPASFAAYNTWNGDGHKPNTLLGTNIRRLTRTKLELTENVTDTNLNVLRTTIYYFER